MKNKTALTVGFIMLCGAFVRLLFLFNSDNFHGIAAGKIIESLRLLKHPEVLYSWIVPAHGPVHMYLMAVAIKIFGNNIAASRWLSYCAGAAVLLPYYGLLRSTFNKDTAIIGVFVAAFFPLHMVHSVLSTAETAFVFLFISGLFFFVKHERSGSCPDLIIAAIAVSLSTMCRFEGALVIIVLAVLLFGRWRKFFIFSAVAFFLPAVWMLGNYVLFGDPLFFLNASDEIVRFEFGRLNAYGCHHMFWKKLFYWPLQFKNYFGWPVFVLGIYGMGCLLPKRKNRVVSLVFLALFFVFVFKTVREELALQPRYGMSLGFLFLGFFAGTFTAIARKIKQSYAKGIIVVFLLFIVMRGTYLGFMKLPLTPQWLKQVSEFLHREITLRGNEAIFIDSDQSNYIDPIKLFSGLDVDKFVGFESAASHIKLLDPLDSSRVKYIVFISKTRLSPRHKEIFRADDCRVFEIKKLN